MTVIGDAPSSAAALTRNRCPRASREQDIRRRSGTAICQSISVGAVRAHAKPRRAEEQRRADNTKNPEQERLQRQQNNSRRHVVPTPPPRGLILATVRRFPSYKFGVTERTRS